MVIVEQSFVCYLSLNMSCKNYATDCPTDHFWHHAKFVLTKIWKYQKRYCNPWKTWICICIGQYNDQWVETRKTSKNKQVVSKCESSAPKFENTFSARLRFIAFYALLLWLFVFSSRSSGTYRKNHRQHKVVKSTPCPIFLHNTLRVPLKFFRVDGLTTQIDTCVGWCVEYASVKKGVLMSFLIFFFCFDFICCVRTGCECVPL